VIVFDTNVLSALMRPELNQTIVDWADQQSAQSIWTTSISLMELRIGILRMPQGKRRLDLETRLGILLNGPFRDRILSLDADAAENAAKINVIQRQRGQEPGTGDTQIAGIVLSRNATLATRNVRHFVNLDIRLVNPWDA
jgi:predicted nucleic acid-binding protein